MDPPIGLDASPRRGFPVHAFAGSEPQTAEGDLVSGTRVLVVDDDPSVLRLTRLQLTEEGFQPTTAQCGEDALRQVGEERPELAIVDIRLPDVSGFELIPQLRAHGRLPVILLTGLTRPQDTLRGFESGADDYVAKPFNPEELTARIRAVLRRYGDASSGERPDCLRMGHFEFDLDRRTVRCAGEVIPLTRSEWQLLEVFCTYPGRVLKTGEILGKAYGPEYIEDKQYLRVWISRLRQKLEPDAAESSLIRTLPNLGYVFGADAPLPAQSR